MTELTNLLTGAVARHAIAHRDITTVFRILREAGVSQTRLAHATGQQQSEISEIISGSQVQSVALLERIADGLGAPRGWMGPAFDPDLGPDPSAQGDAPTEDETNANLLRHAATVLCGIGLARRLRSVEVQDGLAPLQEAAAARRDSACQDLARELATLRSAA